MHANSTYAQRLETYILDPRGSSATIEIQLLKDVIIEPSGTCLSFGFDLLLQPIEEIQKDLDCPPNKLVKLPDTTVAFDQRGVGSQRVEAVLDSSIINPDRFVQHKINFQIKARPASLAVSVSFNSLNNFLFLTISRVCNSIGDNDIRIEQMY